MAVIRHCFRCVRQCVPMTMIKKYENLKPSKTEIREQISLATLVVVTLVCDEMRTPSQRQIVDAHFHLGGMQSLAASVTIKVKMLKL